MSPRCRSMCPLHIKESIVEGRGSATLPKKQLSWRERGRNFVLCTWEEQTTYIPTTTKTICQSWAKWGEVFVDMNTVLPRGTSSTYVFPAGRSKTMCLEPNGGMAHHEFHFRYHLNVFTHFPSVYFSHCVLFPLSVAAKLCVSLTSCVQQIVCTVGSLNKRSALHKQQISI